MLASGQLKVSWVDRGQSSTRGPRTKTGQTTPLQSPCGGEYTAQNGVGERFWKEECYVQQVTIGNVLRSANSSTLKLLPFSTYPRVNTHSRLILMHYSAPILSYSCSTQRLLLTPVHQKTDFFLYTNIRRRV